MNKTVFIVASVLTLVSSPASSQMKEYVLNSTVEIKSADLADTIYNDLLPLKEAIGRKRIVMLGELYHGDAETFKLKSRIVRFLHEQMGFNILVFESDFFGLNDGYELFKAGQISYDSLMYLSVIPLWTKCAQIRGLFYYTKESTQGMHGAELIVSGMDNRGGSGYGYRHLHTKLDAFLKQTNIPFVKTPSYPYFMSAIDRAWSGKNKPTIDSLTALLPVVIDELVAKQSASPDTVIEFYLQVLRGLLDNYKMMLHYWLGDEYKVHKKDYPLHDFGMASNLKWLATRKFPNEKIIVWAHNYHVEKRKGEFPNSKYTSMGQFFIEDSPLEQETYILGTTCFSGTGKLIGRAVTERVAKARKNSIEAWMHSRQYNYAFVDFSKMADKTTIKPFYMKSNLTMTYKQNWTTLYDGVLYIKNAEPCINQNY